MRNVDIYCTIILSGSAAEQLRSGGALIISDCNEERIVKKLVNRYRSKGYCYFAKVGLLSQLPPRNMETSFMNRKTSNSILLQQGNPLGPPVHRSEYRHYRKSLLNILITDSILAASS